MPIIAHELAKKIAIDKIYNFLGQVLKKILFHKSAQNLIICYLEFDV